MNLRSCGGFEVVTGMSSYSARERPSITTPHIPERARSFFRRIACCSACRRSDHRHDRGPDARCRRRRNQRRRAGAHSSKVPVIMPSSSPAPDDCSPTLPRPGAEFVPLNVASKNPLVMLRNAAMLINARARTSLRCHSCAGPCRRLERLHCREATRHSLRHQLVQGFREQEYPQAPVQWR